MGGASEAEERRAGDELLPGLPEELVLAHVMPRLPWYARPVCRAVSKIWKAKLDGKNPELELSTRRIQAPLLRDLFLICTFDKQIFIRDSELQSPWRSDGDTYQVQSQWRRLPPFKGCILPVHYGETMIASSGMIYLWPDREDENFIVKMDIGRGHWWWNKFPVPCCFNSDAVAFNGNIYVPGVSLRNSAGFPSRHRAVVLVYDMMTDKCRQERMWMEENLRVVLKSSHSESPVEEMYSFAENESDSLLELIMYDVKQDCWRTQEKVPIPEYTWSHLADVKLLKGDSFQPALEVGTSIAWVDQENNVITWYDSCRKTWVDVCYDAFWDGKYLEYLQFIRGSLYGIFCEDRAEQEDRQEEEDDEVGDLLGRFIVKGMIMVESKTLAWEVVHEIGLFEETYHVDMLATQPIESYTIMA